MATFTTMGVLTPSGWMELQRIPFFCSLQNMAMLLVSARTAPLLAEYAATKDWPCMAATEDILTMEPPPDSAITGMACLQPRNTPSLLTALILRQLAMSVSTMVPRAIMPALLTRISRRPKRSTVAAITAFQLSSSVTSRRMNTAASPMAAATAWPSFSLRSATTTLAPSRASNIASALPMPLAAPVMIATLPATLPMTVPAVIDLLARTARRATHENVRAQVKQMPRASSNRGGVNAPWDCPIEPAVAAATTLASGAGR